MHDVRLEHALLSVRDLDRSLAFYRTLIPGWTNRWDGRPGEIWVHFGPPGEGQPGYLSIYERCGDPAGNGEALAIEHVGFAHPDVDGLVARLQAAGIEPDDRADDGRYRRVYYRDPDGHNVEFVQRL